MTQRNVCPLCRKDLNLRQINLTMAIYICEDLTCKYPVDEMQVIVVKRRLKQIGQEVSSRPTNQPSLISNLSVSKPNNATLNQHQSVGPEDPELDEEWLNSFLEDTARSVESNSNNSQNEEIDFKGIFGLFDAN